jgi:hypothetical protein
MRLRSALEDFEANTLAAVPGLLGKLSYVAALHVGNGAYSHWGLEKVYGKDAAGGAINTSHRTLLSRILKTPLSVLLQDVRASSASCQLAPTEFLLSLGSPQSLPKSPPPASQVHFRSVLHALSVLAESRHTANHLNA